MDRQTARVYEREAQRWIDARSPRPLVKRRLSALAKQLTPGARVADLGSGPGWYAASMSRLGLRPVAVDLSAAMLRAAGRRMPGLPRVRADLAELPIARESLAAAWAINCYMHLPAAQLPIALAHLHAAIEVGGRVELTLPSLEHSRRSRVDDRFPGRLFTVLSPDQIVHLFECAGFEGVQVDALRSGFWLWVRAQRARTLPDYVRPGLRVLVCGLNPSLYAADSGVPYGRPGNRFWAAARAAGVTRADRDPWSAVRGGLGFSDIVKRSTRAARELRAEEYVAGLQRLEQSVRLHRPGVVCFAGLEGWRRAVDRDARPGSIAGGFAGRPAYLMPSPSGRNAHATPEQLAAHLRRAVRLQAPKKL